MTKCVRTKTLLPIRHHSSPLSSPMARRKFAAFPAKDSTNARGVPLSVCSASSTRPPRRPTSTMKVPVFEDHEQRVRQHARLRSCTCPADAPNSGPIRRMPNAECIFYAAGRNARLRRQRMKRPKPTSLVTFYLPDNSSTISAPQGFSITTRFRARTISHRTPNVRPRAKFTNQSTTDGRC